MLKSRHTASSGETASFDEASERFFEALVNGEFENVSAGQLRALADSRDRAEEALTYDYPSRREPRDVDRTPSQQAEVAEWRRTPLVPDSSEEAA